MQVKQLTLTNVRAFQQATFEFQTGMNLLVGVNGAGKSTVLDILRILFSHRLPQFTQARTQPLYLSNDSIRLGEKSSIVDLEFEVAEVPFSYTLFTYLNRQIRKDDEPNQFRIRNERINPVDANLRDYFDLDRPRDEKGNFLSNPKYLYEKSFSLTLKYLKNRVEQPLVIYFSTRRSLSSMKKPGKTSNTLQVGAFRDALAHRELRLREVAEWWRVQDSLGREANNNNYQHRLLALNNAITRFLGDPYTNLRAVKEQDSDVTTLLLDKYGQTFDVRTLSDGERSMLALVADLARRLSLANLDLTDPLNDGKALVLIDEIDLHLHPAWQRTICDRLVDIFPSCQFIATTHSPQIIGELPPEKIWVIDNGKVTSLSQSLGQSLGMDSNWVLEYVMGVDKRDTDTQHELQNITNLLENEQYDDALTKITLLRQSLGDFSDLVSLQSEIDLINFLGSEIDDEDFDAESED